MSRPFHAAGLLFVLAGVVPAQTASVQNAALASGSGFALLGYIVPNPYAYNRLGLTTQTNIVAPGMLATLSYASLAGWPGLPVTMSIRHSGSSFRLPVEVVGSTLGAITFAVPAGMPLGGAEIEYKIAGQPTGWTSVNVVAASFEFYRIGPGGPAIAQSVAANGSLSPVGLATPAQPGQTVLLTGSGLGIGTTVAVTLGGVPVPLVPAAPHRAQPGRDEILIRIPQGSAVPDGCYVPLALTYNGTTVTSSISKTSSGAPCVHPFQLSAADLKTLDGGGFLTAGQIVMTTRLQVATSAVASRNESANVTVTTANAATLAGYFAPSLAGSGTNCSAVQLNFFGYAAPFNINEGQFFQLSGLGASMTLQNGATTIALSGAGAGFPPATEGPLNNLPAPAIAGGTWTWQSSGGTDLAASSFGFTLPAPLQFTGGAPVTLNRSQDQTLNWNGSNFDSGAMANVQLSGNSAGGTGTVSVSCQTPANGGALTLPAALLSQFAGSSLGTLAVTVNETGASMPHAQFILRNGGALLMLVSYSTGDSRPVDFQ